MSSPTRTGRLWQRATLAGSVLAALGTAHTAYNLTQLRRPSTPAHPLDERVTILLPLRNEAARVRPCVQALTAVLDLDDNVDLLVLDDCSTDDTADVVRSALAGHPQARLVSGSAPPPGWSGKPWACAQLAHLTDASSTVLVFVDADVVLAPHGVRAAVALLRSSGLDLVSPYPRQLAGTPGERLVQPLLQWSWLTTLPLGLAERSSRESLVAANGQFLVVDAAAYRRAGGHASVRTEVLDDIALLRAVKRSGGHGTVVDGTDLATCRMYDSWSELCNGYEKSLWSAFGSPAGAAATMAVLGLAYVVPPLAALRRSRVGVVGYGAAVAGRALSARRTSSVAFPDALAHPASIMALGWLTARSVLGHRSGRLQWKGRPVS